MKTTLQENEIFNNDTTWYFDDIVNDIAIYGNRYYSASGYDLTKIEKCYDSVYLDDEEETAKDEISWYLGLSGDDKRIDPIYKVIKEFIDKGNYRNKDEELYKPVLEVLTGKRWYTATLRGYCQGDWQNCLYSENVNIGEAEDYYFGKYRSFTLYNDDEPDYTIDLLDSENYTLKTLEDYQKVIKDKTGEQIDKVILLNGYHQVTDYLVLE